MAAGLPVVAPAPSAACSTSIERTHGAARDARTIRAALADGDRSLRVAAAARGATRRRGAAEVSRRAIHSNGWSRAFEDLYLLNSTAARVVRGRAADARAA